MENLFEVDLSELDYVDYKKSAGGAYKLKEINGIKCRLAIFKDKEGNKHTFYEPPIQHKYLQETEFPDVSVTSITHSREEYNKHAKIKLI